MTVSTSQSRVAYLGNNVTVLFAVPFPFIQEDYLRVVRTNNATLVATTLVLNSGGVDGYTVQGAGNPTGSVTVVTPPTSSETLSIFRVVPATQEADFVANDPFPAETFEDSLDKLTMIVGQAVTDVGRSLKLFDGDTDGLGRYNANGNRIVGLGDGVDPSDAATVGQLVGAGSGNFIQAGVGAITRTMQNKVRELVSAKDFGAVGDGATDDTAAINSALTYAKSIGSGVFLPAGVYRISGTLLIPGGVSLEGEGWQPYTATGVTNTRGNGTYIQVLHAGSPAILVQKDGASRTSGARIRGIGMFWSHATPSGGWTPTVYDWAIKVDRADDVTVEDVLLINPYKGIQITGTLAEPAGRLNLVRVFGQPILTGVEIDFSADVTCLDRVHFWPFWSDNANVLAWMKANNATFLKSNRNDNAQLSNIFGFGYARGIHISLNASGTTSRMLGANIDFDDCVRAFFVDSTADGSSGSFANFHAQANPATSGADLFVSEADAADYYFSNLRLSNSQVSSVTVTGNNGQFRFAGFWADTWNILAGGSAAISCGAACRVDVVNAKYTGGGAGVSSSGSGIVSSDEWLTFSSTISTGTGTLTTASVTMARYRRRGSMVDINMEGTITTNGTGATSVIMSLPFTSTRESFVVGRERNATGVCVVGAIANGGTSVVVRRFDSAYPGGSGTIINVTGSYEV